MPAYHGGVAAVIVIGVERPGLAAALGRHGLVGVTPIAALVRAGQEAPLQPALVEAADVETAVALLGTADDVVLASDPDALVAARLAALVRRAGPRVLRIGDLAIDLVERGVSRAGAPIALLPREYALLLHLARCVGMAVSRRDLLTAVWGLAFDPGTNVVEVHVSRLRAKLHRGGLAPILLTDKGRGYRLAVA